MPETVRVPDIFGLGKTRLVIKGRPLSAPQIFFHGRESGRLDDVLHAIHRGKRQRLVMSGSVISIELHSILNPS